MEWCWAEATEERRVVVAVAKLAGDGGEYLTMYADSGCWREWAFKLLLVAKAFPHTEHWYCLIPKCTVYEGERVN